MQRARQIASSASGCAAFAEAASELGTPQPEEPAEFMLADLNEDLRPLAAELPVGQASEPMRGPGGVAVLLIGERQAAGGPHRAPVTAPLGRPRPDQHQN